MPRSHRTPRRLALAAGLLALAVPIGAAAHHGWGNYESTQLLTLTGTVEAPSFGYPHASIRLAAEDKTWFIVLAPPSRMTSRGLPDGSLQAGQTVTVQGYPHRTDDQELRAERVTVGDRTVEMR